MKVLLVFSCVVVAALGGGMPGGWSTQEPNDEMRNLLLNLTSDTHTFLTTQQFTLVAVSSQVVAGTNYKFTLERNGGQCEILLWRKLDNTVEISNDNCTQLFDTSPPLVGGATAMTEAELREEGPQKCLGHILDQVNARDAANSMYRIVETEFISATSQVVSGMMYRFVFQVAPSSDCMRPSVGSTGRNCTVSEENKLSGDIWNGTCWWQSWMPEQTQVQYLEMADEQALEKLKPKSIVKLLGGDTHDKIPHGYNILKKAPGKPLSISVLGPELSVQPPKRKLLGKDNKDLVNLGKQLLGGDGHDYLKHGIKDNLKKLLGGDDHDLVDHVKKLIGGDDHDLVDHGKKLLGQDGHDLVNHVQKMLGGDNHDLVNHVQQMLGGDTHDIVDHTKKLLGGDTHDLVDHVQQKLGGDTHDIIDHGKKLLGGDTHDLVNHVQQKLGGDTHDIVNHGKNLLGKDGHDYVQHISRQSLGKRNNTKPLLGGDGHDLCHYGMFMEFKEKFQREYGYGEEDKRFQIFCDNMRRARKMQETERGSARYGATQFADLTEDEFKQYIGKPWDLNANYKMKKAAIPKGPIPESFDWRDHGAVTPVKNQGSCGSCWAFSTTGNIEGQWAIKKGKLLSLSEQELVDCDKVDEGCNGGLPSQAYKEIERLGGLETETEYSYKGEDEKCQFKKSDVKVYINDSVSISQNETEMAQWLAANGPISIGINAMAMQFYMGGISHPWKIFCNPKNLDHGVLIVGYGVKDSEPYWIVKNSWGPSWGEKGYYLVYRGAGVCGLNAMCTSAVVG